MFSLLPANSRPIPPVHPSSPLVARSCQFRLCLSLVLYARKRRSCKKCEDGRLVMCSLPLCGAWSANTFNSGQPEALTFITNLVYGRSKFSIFIVLFVTEVACNYGERAIFLYLLYVSHFFGTYCSAVACSTWFILIQSHLFCISFSQMVSFSFHSLSPLLHSSLAFQSRY